MPSIIWAGTLFLILINIDISTIIDLNKIICYNTKGFEITSRRIINCLTLTK